MLRRLKQKIYLKRNSDNIVFRVLFTVKDFIWKYLFPESLTSKAHVLTEKIKHRFAFKDYTDLSLCKPVKKYAFVFVCQAGKLEVGSLFLAASLKRHLKCDYELIAAIPGPAEIMGTPDEVTLKLLKNMNVRVEHIHNDMVSVTRRSKQHFITNKMFCLRVPTSADKLIFIDSDFLCHTDFHGDDRFSLPFNARPVGLAGTRKFEGLWHTFYKAAGIPMPNIRIRVEHNNQFRYTPPCFNSGFIAINADLAPRLVDNWFKCWHILDRKGLVSHHPYHIGQFSLAVALAKLDIPFEIIERSWMYNYFHICHTPSEVESNESAAKLVTSILEEQPDIMQLVQDNPEWHFLLSQASRT